MNLFSRPLTVKRPRFDMLEAGDLIQILKPRAEEKVVQLTEVLTSPKTDTWLKRATTSLLIGFGIMILVAVVMALVRR